ncbi:hypothetical protein [Aureimonas pseudogalii]|uniref:O-antigen ligase domain-containing protein n=1 Tax=Aureimonas pseudogalii TaxID=1744844 RepID=A0A7W6MK63_9HYPH|nr:hypothetical protein [Aureimonas pseudogalii]MBB3998790.1 hypothetical protein [Aureimonas pseudogalii]
MRTSHLDVGEGARALLRSVAIAGAALAIVAFAVFAHTVHPAIAIGGTVVISAAAYLGNRALAVTMLLAAALFQNLVVSLASPEITVGDFDLARAYSFLMLATIWPLAYGEHWIRFRGLSAATDRHLLVTSAALGAIGLYLLIGMVSSPSSAVIYLRNVATGLLLYQIALIAMRRETLRLQTVIAILAALVAGCGYVELLFRAEWLRFTQGEAYWALSMADATVTSYWDKQAAETGVVMLGLVDTFRITLFNTPLLAGLDIQLSRLFGPNMHAISFGYALAFLSVYALFTARYVLAAALVPLLVLTSVKGAIIVVASTGLGWVLSRLFGTRLAFGCLVALLVVYSAVGIVVGRQIGDFHVLGLMGGVFNFLEFPIGHGLGAGGNLNIDFATLNWPEYQAAGRTPFAMESAVGVLLYQMGFSTAFLLGVYVWLAWRTTLIAARTRDPLHLAVGFALLAIVFNGLFQEEALFSPLAIGLPLLLCGLIHGATFRTNGL